MCECNPNIRSPWCGVGDCQMPKQTTYLSIAESIDNLKEQINNLRNALRRCDPMKYDNFITGEVVCEFCKRDYKTVDAIGHTENCEYIRLIREDK